MRTLIRKSKIMRSLGPASKFGICIGLEEVDPQALKIDIECILERMPDGDEKRKIRETYDYWIANRAQILADNRINEPV